MSGDERIEAGDLYVNSQGMRVRADFGGLLVRFGNLVRIVSDERMVSVLNQGGKYRVRARRGGQAAGHQMPVK